MKKSLPKFFFLLLVTLITVTFFGLIKELIMSVFWATVLTILFHNRFDKIKAAMPGKDSLAALLTIGYALVIVVVPLLVVTVGVVEQSREIIQSLSEQNISVEDKVENLHAQIPIKKKTLKEIGLSKKKTKKKVKKFLEETTEAIAGRAVDFTQNLLILGMNLFLMIYIFFFFLRDGKQIISTLIWVIPMRNRQERALLERFESVARATVKGSLVVAFIQGALGGLMFYLLGIEGAFLWGSVMVLAALLPMGSALIWLPWAIAFLVQGNYLYGIIMMVVGFGFIGLIDNFLQPRLVGKDTKLPDYLILLSTIGGLTWFGLSGFVIGPIIAAFFVTCWEMMGREYGSNYEKVLRGGLEDHNLPK